VRRWHVRVSSIRNARADPSHAAEYLDLIYAYFQNCNHLADWISADVAGAKERVEQLVHDTVDLQICRDICNATKHYRLDRPVRHPERVDEDQGFADGREYVPHGWPADHPIEGETWFVIAAGEKRDIFDLVDRCMAAWENFVSRELPVKSPGTLPPAHS
jgi:hypothetical protein